MAHSYTPGLRVSRLTRIVKERRLPLKGDVTVKTGDSVTANHVIAHTKLPGNVHPVNAAGQLGIVPADIDSVLLVKSGDAIEKGQPIALAKSFFGLFKSTCESPISGTFESASPITGQLILREPPIPVEVTAYIDGKVIETYPDEGVSVETHGAIIQGIFGIGGERYGSIRMVVSSPSDVLEPENVPNDAKGQILVGGSLVTLAAFRKAMKSGAAAVVAGGFRNEELKELLGYEQGVAITGHEEIDSTLILTEGFGQIAMAKRTFNLFAENEGRGASISGATQIRAGVIRPEVIIASNEVNSTPEEGGETGGLEIGNQLRVIREPHFGHIGSVTALPPELQKLESGAMVRVLELELEGGERITLPRANVEIIEG